MRSCVSIIIIRVKYTQIPNHVHFASHHSVKCFLSLSLYICCPGLPESDPSVQIRRTLPDLLKGESAVLECHVTQLSSHDLYITFQVDGEDFGEKQFIEMSASKDLQSITRRVAVPEQHQQRDSTFTCKVNQGFSKNWISMSTGKIFGV